MADNVIVWILIFSCLTMHRYTKRVCMLKASPQRSSKCFQAAALNERLPRMWTFFINALNRSFKALSSYIFMSQDHISPNRSWVVFYKNVGKDALWYDHLVFHLRHLPAKLSIKWHFFVSKHINFISKHLSYMGSKKPDQKEKASFVSKTNPSSYRLVYKQVKF